MMNSIGYISTVEAVRRLASDISDHEIGGPAEPARLVWRKKESAIALLLAAFADGSLTTWVRSASGLVPLVGVDWQAAALWREIIIGGIVCATIGDHLGPFDGQPVLLDAPAFKSWLEHRPRPKPSDPQNDSCQAWLETQMRASPKSRPKARIEFSREAAQKFGVSARHFKNVIWPNALTNTGARWNTSGPVKKSIRSASSNS